MSMTKKSMGWWIVILVGLIHLRRCQTTYRREWLHKARQHVEHKYLWYETQWEEPVTEEKNGKWRRPREGAGTIARSWCLTSMSKTWSPLIDASDALILHRFQFPQISNIYIYIYIWWGSIRCEFMESLLSSISTFQRKRSSMKRIRRIWPHHRRLWRIFFVLFPANVTPRVAGVTFSVCARVSSIIVSALHSRTLSDPNGVFTFHTKSGHTDQHTAHSPHTWCWRGTKEFFNGASRASAFASRQWHSRAVCVTSTSVVTCGVRSFLGKSWMFMLCRSTSHESSIAREFHGRGRCKRVVGCSVLCPAAWRSKHKTRHEEGNFDVARSQRLFFSLGPTHWRSVARWLGHCRSKGSNLHLDFASEMSQTGCGHFGNFALFWLWRVLSFWRRSRSTRVAWLFDLCDERCSPCIERDPSVRTLVCEVYNLNNFHHQLRPHRSLHQSGSELLTLNVRELFLQVVSLLEILFWTPIKAPSSACLYAPEVVDVTSQNILAVSAASWLRLFHSGRCKPSVSTFITRIHSFGHDVHCFICGTSRKSFLQVGFHFLDESAFLRSVLIDDFFQHRRWSWPTFSCVRRSSLWWWRSLVPADVLRYRFHWCLLRCRLVCDRAMHCFIWWCLHVHCHFLGLATLQYSTGTAQSREGKTSTTQGSWKQK